MNKDMKTFFKYVLPSVLSFALSGVYAIVDGFFVGNSIGDIGLSAVNVSYPLVAVIQALGTGIGMGGAVSYSIHMAEKKNQKAREFTAGTMWMLLITSVVLTFCFYFFAGPLVSLLGAGGELLQLGKDYIAIIALGTGFQVIGTGLIPFIRNHGAALYAMIAMITGFIVNIIFDYLFVWICNQGIPGAAWATIIGQAVTMLIALIYVLRKKIFTFNISFSKMRKLSASIIKIGIAPFGLSMMPNLSLVIINRLSIFYGGEKAIATYACIAYVICIAYLVLQGVGDGCQPLMSRYYGEKKPEELRNIRRMAFEFAIFLSVIFCILMYAARGQVGLLFGSSGEVNTEISKIMPVFLLSIPFVAVNRITTASFYATEKSIFSYILTFIEPVLMLILMLILPPFFGGQIMIWWSTVFARILATLLALVLKRRVDRQEVS